MPGKLNALGSNGVFAILLLCIAGCRNDPQSSRCPTAIRTLELQVIGDVFGEGTFTLVPEDGKLRFTGIVRRQSVTKPVLKLQGGGTCSEGHISLSFSGTSPTRNGIAIEDGRLEGLLDVDSLRGETFAAWSATYRYNNGVSEIIRGFARSHQPVEAEPPRARTTGG